MPRSNSQIPSRLRLPSTQEPASYLGASAMAMASPSFHPESRILHALTATGPWTVRPPAPSSVRRSTASSPERRTNESLSSCPARVPTGIVLAGTPLLASGVPAVRDAHALATMRSGWSDDVDGAKSKSRSSAVVDGLDENDGSVPASPPENDEEDDGSNGTVGDDDTKSLEPLGWNVA